MKVELACICRVGVHHDEQHTTTASTAGENLRSNGWREGEFWDELASLAQQLTLFSHVFVVADRYMHEYRRENIADYYFWFLSNQPFVSGDSSRLGRVSVCFRNNTLLGLLVQDFCRQDALPVTRPTAWKHWKKIIEVHIACIMSSGNFAQKSTLWFRLIHRNYWNLGWCVSLW